MRCSAPTGRRPVPMEMAGTVDRPSCSDAGSSCGPASGRADTPNQRCAGMHSRVACTPRGPLQASKGCTPTVDSEWWTVCVLPALTNASTTAGSTAPMDKTTKVARRHTTRMSKLGQSVGLFSTCSAHAPASGSNRAPTGVCCPMLSPAVAVLL
jgi:hypothetical protein